MTDAATLAEQGFRTVFGHELVGELPNFVHRPYLVVTMADLWPRFEGQLDGPSLAGVHLVETLELSALSRPGGAPAEAPRRSSALAAARHSTSPSSSRGRAGCRSSRCRPRRPSTRRSATGRASATRGKVRYLGWTVPGGRLRRLRRHRRPRRRPSTGAGRRRALLPHGTRTTGGSPTRSAGRRRAGHTTPAWSPTPRPSLDAVIDALDDIRDGQRRRGSGPS